jgi:hypothetical protein
MLRRRKIHYWGARHFANLNINILLLGYTTVGSLGSSVLGYLSLGWLGLVIGISFGIVSLLLIKEEIG